MRSHLRRAFNSDLLSFPLHLYRPEKPSEHAAPRPTLINLSCSRDVDEKKIMRDAADVALATDMALGSSVWGDVTATDMESVKVSSWCVITVSLVCVH